MVFRASDVVDLTGLEVVENVRKSVAGVGHVGRGSMMTEVNLIRKVIQSTVDEETDYAAVRTVVLARPVRVEKSDTDRLGPVHCSRVHDLLFIDPLRQRVVVQLPALVFIHHGFRQYPLRVTVDFRTAKVDESKTMLFLHA